MKENEKIVEEATLTYKVLRGQNKIGENLIEVSYGDTKILVELGKALDGGEQLSDVEQAVLQVDYNAVVVSHYHADHAGLIAEKRDCPIYVGKGAYRVLGAISEYHGAVLPSNVATYKNGKPFYVGAIKVTPFLCDHSAYDSYMLLFEAGGRSVLYTGDFRFHGRKDSGKLLCALPKKVDVLITEGTNLGKNACTITESQLENKLVDIMRQNDKPVFVLQSASNIDRLVSVYRAAKRSGRILYEDNFAALVATAAGGSIPRPDVFPDVYAFTPRLLRGHRKDMFWKIEQKRGLKGIAAGKKFVMLVRPSMLKYVEKLNGSLGLSGATLVYSTWSGYKQDEAMAQFLNQAKDMCITVVDLHTSGHASKEDLELLEKAVNPGQIVRVHTEA